MSKGKPSGARRRILKLRGMYGEVCWLCGELADFSPECKSGNRATRDHFVPRKWGGNNSMANTRIAHEYCNTRRDKLYPQSLIFTEEQIYRLTNPHHLGGLSEKARKGLRYASKLEAIPPAQGSP